MKKYFIKLISHSLSTYTCQRISINSGMVIFVQIDKTFVCVVQYAGLCGVLRENALGAHDITYAGHYEKSLCSDNDPCCYTRA